jgi:hypothetical protein
MMCLRGYITEGSPRKSLITALAWVGTRFPPPAKLVFSAFSVNKLPLMGSLSHCIGT